jgi:hypothetical protein
MCKMCVGCWSAVPCLNAVLLLSSSSLSSSCLHVCQITAVREWPAGWRVEFDIQALGVQLAGSDSGAANRGIFQ